MSFYFFILIYLTMKKIGLIGLLLMTYQISFACLCETEKLATSSIKFTDVIFWGEVISLKTVSKPVIIDSFVTIDYDLLIYEFSIITSIKGKVKTKTIQITTDDTSCGFPFRIGEKYVVYANYFVDDSENGRKVQYLFTDICTRTTSDYNKEMKAIYYSRDFRFKKYRPPKK